MPINVSSEPEWIFDVTKVPFTNLSKLAPKFEEILKYISK